MPSEPDEVKICNHCNERIEYLHYDQAVREYGTADFNGDIQDTDGTDGDGDTTYYCPNCREEVFLDELLDAPTEEEEITPEPAVINDQSTLIQETYNKDVIYRICPSCKSRIDLESDDKHSSIKCYTCNKTLTPKNSQIFNV